MPWILGLIYKNVVLFTAKLLHTGNILFNLTTCICNLLRHLYPSKEKSVLIRLMTYRFTVVFFLNLGAEGENSSNISIFMQGILPNNANMLIRYVFKQFWDNEIEFNSMAIVHMKVVESKSMLL